MSAGYLLGGLLRGIGKGVVESGIAKREAARERLRQAREDQRAREERQHERGLLRATVTDRGGEVYGVTAGGEARPLGIAAEGDAPPSGWRRTADGGLEPIPGGPADPGYLARRSEAEKRGEPPETREVKRGDRLVTQRWDPQAGDWIDMEEAPRWQPATLTPAQEANAEEIRQARRILRQWEAAAQREDESLLDFVNRRASKTNPITGLPEPDYTSDATRLARRAAQVIPGEPPSVARSWSQKLWGVDAPPEPGDQGGDGGAAGAGEPPAASSSRAGPDPRGAEPPPSDAGRTRPGAGAEAGEAAAPPGAGSSGFGAWGGAYDVPATPSAGAEVDVFGPGGPAERAERTQQFSERAGEPPGRGTPDSPYRARSQADIDWFRQHAPAGAVIEVDGALYRKPSR